MKPLKHRFTAILQLNPGQPEVQRLSGSFGPKMRTDGRPVECWTITPMENEPGKVHLSFFAFSGTDAVGLANKLMQRCAKGKVEQSNKKKRHRYKAADYKLLELDHPGTGGYDLPTGDNPEIKPKRRGKDMTEVMEFAQ